MGDVALSLRRRHTAYLLQRIVTTDYCVLYTNTLTYLRTFFLTHQSFVQPPSVYRRHLLRQTGV